MKTLQKTFRLLLFTLLISSCTTEDSTNSVITDNNLTLLKEETLAKYNLINSSQKLAKLNNSEINFKKINQILESSDPDEITYDNMPDLLGSFYDQNYFDNLKDIENLSLEILHSDYFETDASNEEKQNIVEDVLVYAFENEIINPVTKLNGDKLANCFKKAESDHKRRLAWVAAAGSIQVAAGGFTFGGSVITGGFTWIGGSIYSGIQYDADVDYCKEQFGD